MDKKNYRILLVEDEQYLRELYERVLSRADFDIVSAIDGQQGWEKAHQMPDLILLDIMLPKMNGIELLKKLKEDEKTKNISIILLSNLGQESIIKKALQDGARGYLMKMRISPYDLIDRVREFLADPNLHTDYNELDID